MRLAKQSLLVRKLDSTSLSRSKKKKKKKIDTKRKFVFIVFHFILPILFMGTIVSGHSSVPVIITHSVRAQSCLGTAPHIHVVTVVGTQSYRYGHKRGETVWSQLSS